MFTSLLKCLHWPLCPGVFIALLAVVAAVGAYRKNPGRWERAAWIFSFLVLMCGEVWMMGIDRQKSEDRQAEADKAQVARFKDIGDGIKSSIDESDKNFNTTIDKTNQVLANITGGDSFGYVVPQPWGEQVPLIVWNHGNQPLTGVTITIARTQEPDWGSAFYKPIFIGTIGPQNYAPVPVFITPKPEEKSGIDHYWIMISAQNGTVSEGLSFRKNTKGSLPWAHSFWVTKDVPVQKAGIPIPKGVPKTARVMKTLLYRAWSDEVAGPH